MPIFLLGPIGGVLIAAAIQGLFGVANTITQNAYNSPRSQLRRLRKAGLPLSYMYRGNVATQSETPKLSIEPTLGVEKKLSLDNQTKLANAQADKIDIENAINRGIQDWLQNHGKEGVTGLPSGSNQVINLELDQMEKRATTFIKEHEERLKQLDRIVANTLFSESIPMEEKRQAVEKIKQQISNMVKQANLMTQLHDVREFEAFLNATVTESIKDLPAWAEVLTAVILKAMSYK